MSPAVSGLPAGVGAPAATAHGNEAATATGTAGRYGVVTRRDVSWHSGRLAVDVSVESRGCCLGGVAGGGAVSGRVVGDAVCPATPDDSDPGPGQNPDGVGMIATALYRSPIDV